MSVVRSGLWPPRFPQVARHHYKVLLGSLLLLVLGSGLAPASGDPALFAALVLQNMLVGVLVVSGGRRRGLLGLCLLAAVLLEGAVVWWGWATVRGLTGLVYSAFCLIITAQVLKRLLTARRVTPELLAASMCGFILLGMVGTFLFLAIDLWQPGAFRGVGEPAASVQTLNYFSFTTLLTVGFGDVVPVSNVARKASVLLGLAGHFYDVFVVGVVVGKYVGSEMQPGGRRHRDHHGPDHSPADPAPSTNPVAPTAPATSTDAAPPAGPA